MTDGELEAVLLWARLARGYLSRGVCDRVEQMVGEVRGVRALLAEFVANDGEPCRYDHNGFCQSHYSGKPCRIERARQALGEGSRAG